MAQSQQGTQQFGFYHQTRLGGLGPLPLETELAVSPILVSVVLVTLGIVLYIISEGWADALARGQAENLILLLIGVAGAIWLLETRLPQTSRVFTLAALIVTTELASTWLSMQQLHGLLVVVVALSDILIGTRATVMVAVTISGLLFLRSGGPASVRTAALVSDLLAIWAMVGIMYLAHRQVRQVAWWALEYLEQAQRLTKDTRQRKAELAQALEDVVHANRQLAQANERMAALRLAAEESRKAKAEFVARVSHEFRTPLNMIIGLVGLMVEAPEIYAEELPPDLQKDLETVYRNCEYLSNMIDDVLDLSRVEAGQLVLHRQPTKLANIVDDALAVVRPLIMKKGLNLRVEIPTDLPEIYCDQTRMREVLLNLVSNAARVTMAGGITVHAVQHDQAVVIGVTDTGPGISQERAQNLFEPFYQPFTDQNRGRGGSGLGLAISKQLIELHGGRIWLESRPGVGTSFYLQIPLRPPAHPLVGAGQWIKEDWVWQEGAFKRGRIAATQELSKPRIIICDETDTLLQEFKRISDEVEFVGAHNLNEAASSLALYPAFALFVNTAMSHEPWRLVETARLMNPGIPVFGCHVSPPIPHAQQAGAKGQLTKPVSRTDLRAALRAAGKPIKHVLAADDDEEFLHLLTHMLKVDDDTIQIVTVRSGEEALTETQRSKPDILFLDVKLPGMDGWQVLKHMRQSDVMRDVPVFLVSAQDPAHQPITSESLAAFSDKGFSAREMLHYALTIAGTMLHPPAPVPCQAPR